MITTACDGYNYSNIFPVGKEFYKKRVKIPNMKGFEITLSHNEFEQIKQNLALHGYPVWKKIEPSSTFYSNDQPAWEKLEPSSSFYSNDQPVGNDFFGPSQTGAVYSIGKRMDGEFPVIIYFQEKGKLICIIADGKM